MSVSKRIHNFVQYIMSQEWEVMGRKKRFITILVLNVVAIVLVILGLTLQIILRPFEPQFRFEYINSNLDCFPGYWCRKEVIIKERLAKGKYNVFYHLNKFYQNNRYYYWSYSDLQLKHKDIKNTEGCGELKKHQNLTIYPCGEVANKMFRDDFLLSYELENGANKELFINKTSTLKTSYKRFIKNYTQEEIKSNSIYRKVTFLPINDKHLVFWELNSNLPMPEDIEFLIWLRPAVTSTVIKQFGYIELVDDLNKGSKLIIRFKNNSIMNGKIRSLLLSKGSTLENNTLLLITELIAVCFIMIETTLFLFKEKFK
eukprot:GAHX01002148.1.p1 GENE.GAHX01002148.1~~GAHX01002148.1.p1  ORF type:complete len:315 (+),score=50.02 GAHX01002148.1:415-1359(+)